MKKKDKKKKEKKRQVKILQIDQVSIRHQMGWNGTTRVRSVRGKEIQVSSSIM